MRIIITGVTAFVIWCFISAWIYNDKLLPVLQKPDTMPAIPETQTREADSLMKLKASMPKDLMIYFEFNNAEFKPDPRYDMEVAGLKAWLDRYPGSMISVTGLTDLVGTPEYNQELGLRRAHSVGRYLEGKGITTDRIITGSLGESKAIENYMTEEGRAMSRRTEITIKMQ